MRGRRSAMAFLAAAAVAGCGSGGGASGDTNDSAQRFSGAKRAEAQVVEDFSDAVMRGDWTKVCEQIYTAQEANLEKGLISKSCESSVEDQLKDNSQMNLTVTNVTTAGGDHLVQSKDDQGNHQSFTVVRVGNGWRIDSYGGTFGAD